MRKTSFQAIARAVCDARHASAPTSAAEQSAHRQVFDSLARELADVLSRESGKFNRVRFLHGCGMAEKDLQKGLTGIRAIVVK